MKCTFLGHQSWLISQGDTHILIDPVLEDRFGHDEEHAIEIFPPRTIDCHNMPPIAAIFLSHEHSDHFHLPTLLQFPQTPILFGPLMYQFVEDLLKEAGLQSKRIPFEKEYRIGEVECFLFHAHQETVLWEGRVSQLLLRRLSDPKTSVFIAVDALVSDAFKQAVGEDIFPPPQLVCVSNNAQITPPGTLETLSNYKNTNAWNKKGAFGVQILGELLIDYLEDLSFQDIAICGGGFSKKYETFFGPYLFSDQKKLAALGQELVEDQILFGPWPGEVITLEGGKTTWGDPVSWVQLDTQRLEDLYLAGQQCQEAKPLNEIRPQSCEDALKDDIDGLAFEKELQEFGRYFLTSPTGEFHIAPLLTRQESSPYLFAFIFCKPNGDHLVYALNINTGNFEKNALSQDEARNLSCGVECFLYDFAAMLQGNLTIWDLVGVSMRAWYEGDKLKSPITALYIWFGEVCRPNLAYQSLKKRWATFFNPKEQVA